MKAADPPISRLDQVGLLQAVGLRLAAPLPAHPPPLAAVAVRFTTANVVVRAGREQLAALPEPLARIRAHITPNACEFIH